MPVYYIHTLSTLVHSHTINYTIIPINCTLIRINQNKLSSPPMGTRSSKQDVRVPHFFFGEVSQHNQFNKEIIVVSKQMLRMDEFDDWLIKYKEAKTMKHDSLLLPQSYEIETIKKFWACCECPADFQMSLSFEKFEFLFKSQIVQRRKSSSFYREQELFLILYNFLVGLKEFQIKGKRVGDIRPSQIVITNQKSLKMINLASFPWELSSIDKILDKYDHKTKFYLAPEEIDFINKGTRSRISEPKAEAFSLGITLLEAATLQNSEDLYQFNPRSLNQNILNERLTSLKRKYSVFHGYLSLLLKVSTEERLSGGELWSILHVYSENIAQSQRFSPNQAKEKNALSEFRKKPYH